MVADQSQRVKSANGIEKELTKSGMLRKTKLKRPLRLVVEARPLKRVKTSTTPENPPPTQVSNPLTIALALEVLKMTKSQSVG